mmetsp:Transcript_12552/g.29728  ORF Transcript_12552/g.29728 Transcript_12552/m.29728 type:complete len:219 (-) Transcript_12552:768-1424(-)
MPDPAAAADPAADAADGGSPTDSLLLLPSRWPGPPRARRAGCNPRSVAPIPGRSHCPRSRASCHFGRDCAPAYSYRPDSAAAVADTEPGCAAGTGSVAAGSAAADCSGAGLGSRRASSPSTRPRSRFHCCSHCLHRRRLGQHLQLASTGPPRRRPRGATSPAAAAAPGEQQLRRRLRSCRCRSGPTASGGPGRQSLPCSAENSAASSAASLLPERSSD